MKGKDNRRFSGHLSDRLNRLLGCGICRRMGPPNVPGVLEILDVCEAFADGRATVAELDSAWRRARQIVEKYEGNFLVQVFAMALVELAHLQQPDEVTGSYRPTDPFLAGNASMYARASHPTPIGCDSEADPYPPLFDDVAPRPGSFFPEWRVEVWRTDTALSLARMMYESRNFGAMPILADALQDAGCDNQDILIHCRDPQQVHIRGCWVVDLVLGKK